MFTVFYEQVPQYLFCRKGNQYVFRHDAHLVYNSDFENLGKLMAVGFLLGLPGPRNWSVPLSWYILGSQAPCTIGDVPIHEVMVKLEGINNAESQNMLDVIFEDFDERFEAGYNKMDIQLVNKNDIIEKVTRYFVITRQLEEINQFLKGVKKLNVLQNLKLFKDETIKEFIVSSANKLTSKILQEIFEEVKHGECEEKRKIEQDIINNWINILDKVESGIVKEFLQTNIMSGVEKEQNVKIKLKDALFFLTGSKFLRSNISNGTFLFNHQTEEGRRIKIGTCLYFIEFPVSRRYCGDNFSRNFIEDIIQSPGFGQE